MSRVRVTLEIEEKDLMLFQHPEGVILPTRVVKFVKEGDHYTFSHAFNPDAEVRAVPYRRFPDGDYPD